MRPTWMLLTAIAAAAILVVPSSALSADQPAAKTEAKTETKAEAKAADHPAHQADAADKETSCDFCKAKEGLHKVAPWLTLFADMRLRYVFAPNLVWNDDKIAANDTDTDWQFQRYRFRLGATVTPCKDLDLNFRLVYEPRHYCSPESRDDPSLNEAIFDLFNIKYKNVCGLPVTATVGRQEIILGNGWLVLDGTPLDGSRTLFFDAARLTTELKDCKTTIDTIYINQHSDSDRWLEPFNDQDVALTEQNEQGAILYVTNRSLARTEVNGYFIYKHDRQVLATGHDSDIYGWGGRVVHDLNDNWQARAEFIKECGHQDGCDLDAWGFNGRLTYKFNDRCKSTIHVGYEFLSGDDPGSSTNERFDPLWGRWPQWSEGYGVYSFITESGRPNDLANLHRINVGWGCSPCEKLFLQTNYDLLFTDENYPGRQATGFSPDGCLRGQQLSAKLTYQFNEHISGHVLAELFFPGDFYTDARNDVSGFFRYELTIAW